MKFYSNEKIKALVEPVETMSLELCKAQKVLDALNKAKAQTDIIDDADSNVEYLFEALGEQECELWEHRHRLGLLQLAERLEAIADFCENIGCNKNINWGRALGTAAAACRSIVSDQCEGWTPESQKFEECSRDLARHTLPEGLPPLVMVYADGSRRNWGTPEPTYCDGRMHPPPIEMLFEFYPDPYPRKPPEQLSVAA